MKILAYSLVSATDGPSLGSAVNRAIELGYQPFGSPAVAMSVYGKGNVIRYCQAVVKWSKPSGGGYEDNTE